MIFLAKDHVVPSQDPASNICSRVSVCHPFLARRHEVAVHMEVRGSCGDPICLLLEKALKNQGPCHVAVWGSDDHQTHVQIAAPAMHEDR